LFNINLVEYLTKKINMSNLNKIIYIIIGISSIIVLSDRDIKLPFLGKTVLPCFSLDNKYPSDYTHETDIQVKPFSKIIYWAANETKNEQSTDIWTAAYGNYENYGITQADNNGFAKLRYKYPTTYTVPYKGLLKPHIHYRVCLNKGMLSKIYTLNLK
jgi:hypothetical protein